MAYTVKLSDVKLTDQMGGADVYLDIYNGEDFSSTTAVHYDSVPTLQEIIASPEVARLLSSLNGDDLTARLFALQSAKGAAIQPADAPVVALTKYQFRSLFTLPELVAMDNFEQTPAIPDEAKQLLRTMKATFDAAQDVSLNDIYTQQGVYLLAQVGILTQQRAGEILSNTPPPVQEA